MNHQIQHHIHIQRPRRKHAQPMRLKEHRPIQQRPRRRHRRIEPLQMPHLHHPPMRLRRRQNPIRIRQRPRQRLLNQQIHARRQQQLRHRRMMHRRHANRSSIQPQIRQTLLNLGKPPHPKLLTRSRSNARISIHHRHQLDRMPRSLQLPINPQMVPPKRPRAHHRHPQNRAVTSVIRSNSSTVSREWHCF